MTNTQLKVGKVCEEIKAAIGDEFEVSVSDGGIILYNNNEKRTLSDSETYQLLQDAGLELRYTIIDENQQYCIQHSIKLVDKRNKQYIYNSYPRVEHCYPTSTQATQVRQYLQFMNQCAKMNHNFSIEVFSVPVPQYYTIVDQDDRVVDHRSISLVPSDDESSLVWQYCTFTSVKDGGFFYSSKELAQEKVEGLNLIKQFAGFTDLEFHVEELQDYSNDGYGISRRYLPVANGKKTESRKIFRDYMKLYY